MRISGPLAPGSPLTRRRSRVTRTLIVGLAAAGLAVAAPAGPATAQVTSAHAAGDSQPNGRHVDHLQVDHLTTPLGIDDTAPKLSWQVSGESTAAVQTGYQVRVATRANLLTSGHPDLWDSGKVASSQIGYVKYSGKALHSREDVYWQVRAWTAAGVSAWSAPSSWEMGLLATRDWTAKWIEDPQWTDPTNRWPVFGKTFTVKGTPSKARLYVTGLGMETTKINGKPIGDAVLEPGESDYKTEVQYRAYDVASLLHKGTNRIEISTGSGWYLQTAQSRSGRFNGLGSNNGETGAPRVIGQLEITQHDGSRQTVATGPDWLTAFGPTTFSSWFGGEDYNAQLAQAVGDVPAKADSTWTHAADSLLFGTVSQATSATGNTTPAQPAAVGDKNVKVNSVTGAVVGAPVTVGTGATKESATITSVGTPAVAAPLATPAAAGDTTVQVTSVGGFAAGQQLVVGTGASAETRTVTNVGTAARSTSLQAGASAGDTNLKVTGVANLTVGDHVVVDPGTGQEQVTVTSVGTAGTNTTLSAASAASANTIKVAAVTGFAAGDVLQIGAGANSETATVQTVGTGGANGSGLTLTANLTQAHAQGTVILNTSKPGTGLGISSALTSAHMAAAAVSAPGTGLTFSPALTNAHLFGASVQAPGSGITFAPALAHPHASGEAAAAIGPTTPRVDTPLVANPRLPVTVVATKKAVSITNPSPGVYVFDFGRNFAGWPVLDLKHPTAGQNIQIVPGEGPSLTSAGLVTESWSSSNGTRYDYVPSSDAKQTWHPDFAYSGFRWLQVSGLSSPPTANTVYAQQLMTANPVASHFSSSATPLLNQIDMLVRNAEEANMESVLTDCPNREKAPYTGDTAQDIDTELNDYDLRGFLTATMRNFVESQQPNGEVLSTGPEWHTIENGTNWGGAIVEVPWGMYQAYGDTSILSTYYANMSSYIDFVNSRSTGNLVDYGLADWETSDPNPPLAAYTNSYGYYVQVQDMAKIAAVLGKTDDATMYTALGQKIAAAFNAKYLNSTTHTYSNGDMADDALALDAGLVPADQQAAVLNHMLATIASNNGLITVGSVSLEPIIHVLHNTGHDDVLYKWATSTAYPSYGYILASGATTMTETWNLNPKDSQNHHFLGGIDAWFTSGLAGIQQATGTAGFSSPVIKPSVLGTTSNIKGDYTSAYGTIADNWSLTGPSSNPTSLTMKTTIPVGSPGTVEIPQLNSSRVILEDGHVIWSGGKAAKRVTATLDGDYIAVSNVTGTHTFTWRTPR